MKIMDQMNTSTESLLYINVSSTPRTYGPVVTAANYLLFLICVVTVLTDSFALCVVYRGRTFPRFCRYLSLSYLVSDLTGAAFFALHQLIIFSFGYTNESVLMSRVSFSGVSILISSASLALISLERVFALLKNLTYTSAISATRIGIIIVSVWIFNITLVLTTVFPKIEKECQWDQSHCYLYDVFKLSRYVMMTTILLYDIILIATNAIIQCFVRKHVSRIIKQESSMSQNEGHPKNVCRKSYDEYQMTKSIAKILVSYLVLHLPMTTTMFLHEWYEHLRDDVSLRSVRILSCLCIQISSYIHLYLYVFKFKENKLNAYLLLSYLLKRYKLLAERLRMDVYNIPYSDSNIPPRATSF